MPAWPALQMAISRWNDVADRHGVIVVYPAGTGAFPRGLHVCPQRQEGLAQEVQFIADLIDKLGREYHIDSNRMYVNGMSNGGGMAIALTCRLSEKIAAVGIVAAAIPAEWDCGASQPVPTMVFHGAADRLAPYCGGSSPAEARSRLSIFRIGRRKSHVAIIARMRRWRSALRRASIAARMGTARTTRT
jgi:poly(3-hydroxybutyrate) depolymerase